MKTKIIVLTAIIAIAAAGCSKPEDEEPGTMEKVGRQLDQAGSDVTEYTGNKLQEAGSAMERAGGDLSDDDQEREDEEEKKD